MTRKHSVDLDLRLGLDLTPGRGWLGWLRPPRIVLRSTGAMTFRRARPARSWLALGPPPRRRRLLRR